MQPERPHAVREWCEREYGSVLPGVVTLALAGAGLLGFAIVGVIAAVSALA
jgi:hypothetical protein